jgi:small GTP-binding protein
MLIGDSGVGKTCLMERFVNNEFHQNLNKTIGADFCNFFVRLKEQALIKLMIWDTSGQERFRVLNKLCYRNVNAFFVVYNVNNKDSFDNVEGWLKGIEEYSNIQIYLVGNRADEDKRMVSYEEAEKYWREKKFNGFIETSALTGMNVQDLFSTVTKKLFVEINPDVVQIYSNKNGIQLEVPAPNGIQQ